MVEQRSPKPSVACSTRVSPAKSVLVIRTLLFFIMIFYTTIINKSKKTFLIGKICKKRTTLSSSSSFVLIKLVFVACELSKVKALE